jgi:predicted DNA-binding transcriptional regulator AlpA
MIENNGETKELSSNEPGEPQRLLKAGEVAKILNISRAFAYQLMREDFIPTVKILGARRVRPKDLEHFIEENTSG